MTADKDYRIRDLGRIMLVLRSDLVFTPQKVAGEPSYLIEDRARSRFFRVGLPEYTLISILDGKTTVGEALSLLAKARPELALNEPEAAGICKWLIDSELAYTPESVRSQRLAEAAKTHERMRILATWNPLCSKVPLVYPNRFFDKIHPWLGWIHSLPAAAVSLLVAVVALYRVQLHWDQFAAASTGIFSPGRWLWLILCWMILKIVHELAHGLACKRHGGAVHEAGVIFVLFAPLAYVDVTSSWRFGSKWQRIHVAAAGMYVELSIAAVAAILWTVTGPGLFNDICFNLVLMASLTTLAFNANPLMRFDGYYILSDLLEIPNLYADGQQYLRYLGRRYLMGVRLESPLEFESRDLFIRVYGVAALLWRIFICAVMVMAAATFFHGIGLLLALLALVFWLFLPLVKLAKYVIYGDGGEAPNRIRLAWVTGCLTVLGLIAMTACPWPGVDRAPAIVEYAPLTVVRAGSSGFAKEVRVHSGQTVAKTQVLAVLDNEELVLELRDLQLAIEQSELKCRALKHKDELAAYQAERKDQEALQKKRDEKQAQVDQLTVRAPASGKIVTRNPQALLGTYLAEGTEIMSIGSARHKELRVAIAQEDVDVFSRQVGKPVHIRMPGSIVLTCPLSKVTPRASMKASHPSLYAPCGGRLEARKLDSGEPADEAYELLTPRFTGVISLTAPQSDRLRAGQRGVVWFGRGRKKLGDYFFTMLRDLVPEAFARQYHLAP